MQKRKIRMGMVGGGQGAFIGGVHRIAAAIDQQIELVCGAFSSDPERSKASGKDLNLEDSRCYTDFMTMMAQEAKLPEGERMDFVAIVTPNHVHFPAAKAALEAGFHVLSDKPATFDKAEAIELEQLVEATGLKYGLTHNYTGYPMVKQAREMVQSGELGKIRKVVVEYPQGWLATALEKEDQKQAAWRTDPKRSGAAGCMGDIGTHAENLAEYLTGLKIKELAADLTAFVDDRLLDDDGNVLLRFEGELRGFSMPRRSQWAKKTRSTYVSTVKKAVSSGTRWSRTPYSSTASISRHRSTAQAMATLAKARPRTAVSQRGIQKATWKPLPISIETSQQILQPNIAANPRLAMPKIIPQSKTASAAWHLSKRL